MANNHGGARKGAGRVGGIPQCELCTRPSSRYQGINAPVGEGLDPLTHESIRVCALHKEQVVDFRPIIRIRIGN